jgi:hypothetical protein
MGCLNMGTSICAVRWFSLAISYENGRKVKLPFDGEFG